MLRIWNIIIFLVEYQEADDEKQQSAQLITIT